MSEHNLVRPNTYSGQDQEFKDDLLLEAEFALELITASCKNAEARCIELEDQLESSRQELSEVRKQLLQCREQMIKVIEVETNERKLEESRSREILRELDELRGVRSELGAAKMRVEELECERNQLDKFLEKERILSDKRVQANQQLEELLANAENEISSLKDQLSETNFCLETSELKCADLDQRLQAVSRSLSDTTDALDQAVKSNDLLKTELADVREQRESDIRTLRDVHELHCDELNSQLTSARRTLGVCAADLAEAKATNVTLEKTIEGLTSKLTRFLEVLEVPQIDSLSLEMKTLRSTNADLIANKEELEAGYLDLQTEAASFRSQFESMAGQAAEAEARVLVLEVELDATRQAALENAQSQRRVEALEEQLSGLRVQLEASRAALPEDVGNWRQELAEKEMQLAQYQRMVQETKNPSLVLTAENSRLRTLIVQYERDQDSMRKKITDGGTELSSAREEISVMQGRLRASELKIVELSSELLEYMALGNNEYSSRLADQDLREENEHLRAKADASEATVGTLTQQCREYRESLSSLSSYCRQLEDQNEDLMNINNSLAGLAKSKKSDSRHDRYDCDSVSLRTQDATATATSTGCSSELKTGGELDFISRVNKSPVLPKALKALKDTKSCSNSIRTPRPLSDDAFSENTSEGMKSNAQGIEARPPSCSSIAPAMPSKSSGASGSGSASTSSRVLYL